MKNRFYITPKNKIALSGIIWGLNIWAAVKCYQVMIMAFLSIPFALFPMDTVLRNWQENWVGIFSLVFLFVIVAGGLCLLAFKSWKKNSDKRANILLGLTTLWGIASFILNYRLESYFNQMFKGMFGS